MVRRFRAIFTARAERQLDDIVRYIVRSSPQNAFEVLQRIRDTATFIAGSPIRNDVAGYSRPRKLAVHTVVESGYVIYYIVFEGEQLVRIVEVRRGSRRQPRSFRDDER